MTGQMEIVRKFCALMEDKDVEALRPFLADDVIFLQQGNKPIIGIENVLAYQAKQFEIFPFKYERRVINIAEGGEFVMTERLDFTTSQQGHTLGVPVAGSFQLKEGKIVRWTDYTDRMARAAALWVPETDDEGMDYEGVQKMRALLNEAYGKMMAVALPDSYIAGYPEVHVDKAIEA